MKRYVFLILLSYLFSIFMVNGQSLANDNPLYNPFVGATHYEQLESYFSVARTPNKNEFNGWWSGRCYFRDQPRRVRAILIVSNFVEQQQYVGPLMVKENLFKIIPIFKNEASPDFFDNMSYDDIRTLLSYQGVIFKKVEVTESMGQGLISKALKGNITYELRAIGSDYILKISLFNETYNVSPNVTYCQTYTKILSNPTVEQ